MRSAAQRSSGGQINVRTNHYKYFIINESNAIIKCGGQNVHENHYKYCIIYESNAINKLRKYPHSTK
jgi:hypothetical protein